MKQKNQLFDELSNLAYMLNECKHTLGDVSVVLMLWDHNTGEVYNLLYGNVMKHITLISCAISKMAENSDGKVSTDIICDLIKAMCRHQEDYKDEYEGD